MPGSRRNSRLSDINYLGCRTYFITICCDRRQRSLADARSAQAVLASLYKADADYRFILHAFCAMPDHLHILAEGIDPSSNLREFIRLFKQCSAFAFRRYSGGPLWEKSYYDYILRPADAIEHVARYIWWNPVRSNLCARPGDFPFSGSQSLSWMSVTEQSPSWRAPWKSSPPSSLL